MWAKNDEEDKIIMPDHEHIVCPRCKQTFECKVGSINLCHCSDARLSLAQRNYVSKHWDSCLRAKCLTEIKQQIKE